MDGDVRDTAVEETWGTVESLPILNLVSVRWHARWFGLLG